MKIDKYLNWKELGFDLGVITLLLAGAHLYDLSTLLSTNNTPSIALAISFAIQFFIALQLADIASDYSRLNKQWLNKIIITTAGLVLLFLLMSPIAYFDKIGIFENTEGYMMASIIGGIFLLLAGFMMGYADTGKLSQRLSMGAFVLGIPFYFFAIYLALVMGMQYHSWLVGIGVFIGGIVLVALISMAISSAVGKTTTMIVQNSIALNISRFIIYLLFAIAFIWWQNINIGLFGYKGSAHISNVFILMLTGILPLRILMAFAPPQKIINLIIGVIMLGLDFASLIGFTIF